MEKTIFNTEVNSENFYSALTPPKKKNGKFVKYDFIDVTKYCNINAVTGNWDIKSEYLELFSNIGIRKKQNTDRDVETLSFRLDRQGLKPQYFPPIIDEKNLLDIEDGRKRIQSYIEKKERYCLVAIYRFDRDEKNFLKSKLTNGFRSNLHDTADPTDADGIVSACGALLKVGELKKIESDIREYLIDYSNLDEYFPTLTLNNIVEKVKALDDETGFKQIISMERHAAVAYLKKSLGFDFTQENDEKEIVLYTPSEVNDYRTYCKHIAPNSRTNKKTEIYLYTQGYDIVKVNDDLDIYIKTLTNVIGDCSFVVNHDANDSVKLKTPWVSTLHKIKGVIPQKTTAYQQLMFEDYKTISIQNFKDK